MEKAALRMCKTGEKIQLHQAPMIQSSRKGWKMSTLVTFMVIYAVSYAALVWLMSKEPR